MRGYGEYREKDTHTTKPSIFALCEIKFVYDDKPFGLDVSEQQCQ